MDRLRVKVAELRDVIHLIETTPPAEQNDTFFIDAVSGVNATVRDLLDSARVVGKHARFHPFSFFSSQT